MNGQKLTVGWVLIYHSTSDFVVSFDTHLSAAPLWLCILEYSQGSQTRFLPDEAEIYTATHTLNAKTFDLLNMSKSLWPQLVP